jgi:hypothetical protein
MNYEFNYYFCTNIENKNQKLEMLREQANLI